MTISKTTRIVVTKSTKVELTREQVEDILRQHFEAPPNADVFFDVGYDDFLRGASIEWNETTIEPAE